MDLRLSAYVSAVSFVIQHNRENILDNLIFLRDKTRQKVNKKLLNRKQHKSQSVAMLLDKLCSYSVACM